MSLKRRQLRHITTLRSVKKWCRESPQQTVADPIFWSDTKRRFKRHQALLIFWRRGLCSVARVQTCWRRRWRGRRCRSVSAVAEKSVDDKEYDDDVGENLERYDKVEIWLPQTFTKYQSLLTQVERNWIYIWVCMRLMSVDYFMLWRLENALTSHVLPHKNKVFRFVVISPG